MPESFELIKRKLTSVPVLTLPNFELVFKVKNDASRVGTSGVLTQKGKAT